MAKNKWFTDNVSEDVAKSLFKIEIKLDDGRTIERDYVADVDIDYDNLEEQMKDMPSIYSFWSVLLAEQKLIVSKIERQIKRRRGKIVEELTSNAKNSEETKTARSALRATDIKELIEADDNLLALETKYILAERTLSKLYAVVKALEIKSDNLRSLCSIKKQEMRHV